MSIEHALIEHCSPTLAGLKAGSLFSFLAPASSSLEKDIGAVNALLSKKGLTLQLVKPLPARALCYLYRAAHLERMLVDPENAAFLRSQGYESLDVQGALSTLCTRLCVREEFPHEIGLFLGYPLGDVIGFMEHKGKNCLCCGCWKAYTDACAAKRQFDRFNKCTCVYRRLYGEGRPLTKLAVPS